MIKNIKEIRILPNDTETFATEKEFKNFITRVMPKRGGTYYFPSHMLRSKLNTLVMFQYKGCVRATGCLVKYEKVKCFDERGKEYAGYYSFDVESLVYLNEPITFTEIQKIYPDFIGFSQSKAKLPRVTM